MTKQPRCLFVLPTAPHAARTQPSDQHRLRSDVYDSTYSHQRLQELKNISNL